MSRQPTRQRQDRMTPDAKGIRLKRTLPYIVLAVFVAMTAVGLGFDEFRAVLANAITICLSCIGIG